MKYFLFFMLIISNIVRSDFNVEVINSNLKSPWGFARLPDGRFLVTEKPGSLFSLNPDGSNPQLIGGLPDIANVGQGGLLDVAVHPQFKDNQLIYISYVAGNRSQGYGTEVLRAKLDRNQLVNSSILFQAQPKVRGGRHFGSRLLFDREGYLYVSLGDRGERKEAQNLSNHIGSLIRLNEDGSIPKDNPFVSVSDAMPEIYSYGHRNIQGLALDPHTGKIWAHEHGPRGGDEINIIKPGKNYGWPRVTYGKEYGTGFSIGEGVSKEGLVNPVHYWVPSIAPSGMAFFNKELYVGALKSQLLSKLSYKGETIKNETYLFEREFGRIRDVKAFGDSLYLLTESRQSALVRLSPKSTDNIK